MKPLYFLAALILTVSALKAQKKAVTETGQQVFLFDDGTWKYASDTASGTPDTSISMNPKAFSKGDAANFPVKSEKVENLAFWIDPQKWEFTKGDGNPKEYTFQLKGGDLYAMAITEGIKIPLTTLAKIAFQNAQKVAPDVHIIHREYRMVNGIKVLNLELKGTLQGVIFIYYGYYYSNANGTVQLVCYTGDSEWEGYKADAEKLLNGLAVLK
jgi:hypothetical protein